MIKMYMGPNDKSKLFRTSNFSDKTKKDFGKSRTILHCDADSFFASCETVLHPEYSNVPMAVCGSVEDRHGIVLAKNALAKKYGIKTAETVWSAKQKCPNLLTVRPTYGLYSEISEKMNRIFYDFTDLVEPFGIDESWLDVTGSERLFGNGYDIAKLISERVEKELGITISIGVSFNKVFAKLGSDLNKPNGITVIPPNGFASIVWRLPVGSLLFVGHASVKLLAKIGVKTIGELACADEEILKNILGKNGKMLRDFARGLDFAEVSPMGYEPEPKSVSNGMTFRANLKNNEEISFALTYLSMSVAERLRKHGLCCNAVSVTVRSSDQTSINRSSKLDFPTCLYSEISEKAFELVKLNYTDEEIYSVTVHAEKLSKQNESGFQQMIFPSEHDIKYQKLYSLETTIDSIRTRFGQDSIGIASAINNHLIV